MEAHKTICFFGSKKYVGIIKRYVENVNGKYDNIPIPPPPYRLWDLEKIIIRESTSLPPRLWNLEKLLALLLPQTQVAGEAAR